MEEMAVLFHHIVMNRTVQIIFAVYIATAMLKDIIFEEDR